MNQYQLTMMRGDSRTFTITLTDSAGDPYDLTGASLWFTVGNLVEKTVGDGITVETPANGVATIDFVPADTESVSDVRRAYRYDVQVKLSDGTVKTPIRGLFVITPDVTTETS